MLRTAALGVNCQKIKYELRFQHDIDIYKNKQKCVLVCRDYHSVSWDY